MFSVHSANWLSYLALVAFVPLGLVAYRALPPVRATLVLVFAGVMFLPELVALDPPLLPRLGKESVVYIAIALGMLSTHRSMLQRFPPGKGIELLILVMIVGGMLTTLLNTDALHYGPRTIPGMAPYEMITASVLELLRYGLPFYFGRILFRSQADLEDALKALTLAGLVYTAFLAIELRLSPQMHRWTYGFHQNDFTTLNRWGGYRPMVYMESGIAVGIFMVNTVMASSVGLRARLKLLSAPSAWVMPYLLVFLMLTKSVASMVWGALFAPLLLLLSPRRLALIAVLMAGLVFFYPMLRLTDLFPWREIVSVAESVSPDRARSLNYRFENDENMLGKARERFLFGWGGYSRNWAYDPETGEPLTVPDGAWIIRLSSNGLVGFYCLYSLYVIPVVLAFMRLPRIPGKRNQMMIAGLMLIVIIRAVDQLPNGLYSSYPIFLAGALYNLTTALPLEHARKKRAARQQARDGSPDGPSRPELASEKRPRRAAPEPAEAPASTAALLGLREDRERRR